MGYVMVTRPGERLHFAITTHAINGKIHYKWPCSIAFCKRSPGRVTCQIFGKTNLPEGPFSTPTPTPTQGLWCTFLLRTIFFHMFWDHSTHFNPSSPTSTDWFWKGIYLYETYMKPWLYFSLRPVQLRVSETWSIHPFIHKMFHKQPYLWTASRPPHDDSKGLIEISIRNQVCR